MKRKYFYPKSKSLSRSSVIRYGRVEKLIQRIEDGKGALKGMNAMEVYMFFLPFFEDAIGYKLSEFTAQEEGDLETFREAVYQIIGTEPNLSALPSMKDNAALIAAAPELLGLSLAIGIVVDDAIMMLENIVRYNERGMGRVKAALETAKRMINEVDGHRFTGADLMEINNALDKAKGK